MTVDLGGLGDRLAARFGGEAAIYRAPGRVNLIGEHTDYSDGFVMPVAIDLATSVAIGRRPDRRLVVSSESVTEAEGRTAEVALDALELQGGWTNYVFGVAKMLQRHGVPLTGANLLIASEVPPGAGLGSSAALEVAVAAALADTAGVRLDGRVLARLCQQAENEYVGAACGIMDQFVALHGRAGHALMLDCRSLDFTLAPLPREVGLVVCNTMVRHAIAAGGYNARRHECDAAVRALARRLPHIRALRDVTDRDLQEHADLLEEPLSRRARHVVTENGRVAAFGRALHENDLAAAGRLMAESHASLRDDFEVSCPELDLMVEIARSAPGAIGARMTGGGFGGCTLNLVSASAVRAFSAKVSEQYTRHTRLTPEIYVCNAADGALPR
jgi:galactokinase